MTTTALATPDREPLPARLAAGYQLAEREWARALGAYQGDGAAAIYERTREDPCCGECVGGLCYADARNGETFTGAGLAPIESDDLDRAQEARLAAEDDARTAAWYGDRNGDYEWDTL